MKIFEVTSAQDQLDLLRTIIDKTWLSIEQEAAQERIAKAAAKGSNKAKPKAKAKTSRPKAFVPPPPQPAAPIAPKPLAQTTQKPPYSQPSVDKNLVDKFAKITNNLQGFVNSNSR